MSCDVGKEAELILQPFRHFTYITTHSPTLPSFTYVTAHSPTLSLLHLPHSSNHSPTFPSLHLRHSSFSKPFRRFTYVTDHSPTILLLHLRHHSAHSPNFPSLHLRHSSFFNPSVALSTSQIILQPFRCLTYVTTHSSTLLSLLLRHRLFTYVTWRAARDVCNFV